MIQRLWILGRLPGLNDLLDAKGSGHGKGNAYGRLKAKWTAGLAVIAKAKLEPVACATFRFQWYEADRRRDPDNVSAGGRKLILDALVEGGVLPNDGWAEVLGWTEDFAVEKDKSKQGVMVTLESP